MQATAFAPSAALAAFVRTFMVVEGTSAATRALLPQAGLVLGLQFRGSARHLHDGSATPPGSAGLTGLRTTSRRVCTSAGSGVLIAVFREAGAAHFFAVPLFELFGVTVALDDLVPSADVARLVSRVSDARDHAARVALLEQFLLGRTTHGREDRIVSGALRRISHAHGALRIAALARELGVGMDSLEKRFRRAVGASPKQFATIVRMQSAIDSYRAGCSLTRVSHEAGYFDQSHFNREFRSFTGQAPHRFFRTIEHC